MNIVQSLLGKSEVLQNEEDEDEDQWGQNGDA
jgi:hypothetical protein